MSRFNESMDAHNRLTKGVDLLVFIDILPEQFYIQKDPPLTSKKNICFLGGNGNTLNIQVEIIESSTQPTPVFYEHIEAIKRIHLDPTQLTKPYLKAFLYHILQLNTFIDQTSQQRLCLGVIQFFQALIDANSTPLQAHQLGYLYDMERAHYLHYLHQIMNQLLIKNNLTDYAPIVLHYDETAEDFRTYIPDCDLSHFRIREEDYEQWALWSKQLPQNCLADYLAHILEQIQKLHTTQVRQIGQEILHFCHYIEQRSQSLVVIKMLKEMGLECLHQSPPRQYHYRPPLIDSLKASMVILINAPEFHLGRFRAFEHTLIHRITNKTKEVQTHLITELKEYVAQLPDTPATECLRVCLNRLYSRLIVPCPLNLAEQIQTLREDYNRETATPRQRLKQSCLEKIEQTIRTHPFRNQAYWLTETQQIANHAQRALLTEPLNEPSFFCRYRFKTLIRELGEDDIASIHRGQS